MADTALKELNYDGSPVLVECAKRDGSGNVIADKLTSLETAISNKQDKLSAGTNIQILNNQINAVVYRMLVARDDVNPNTTHSSKASASFQRDVCKYNEKGISYKNIIIRCGFYTFTSGKETTTIYFNSNLQSAFQTAPFIFTQVVEGSISSDTKYIVGALPVISSNDTQKFKIHNPFDEKMSVYWLAIGY